MSDTPRLANGDFVAMYEALHDTIERLRAEIERLRAALEGVRTSVGQALDRIDRAPVPRTTGVNPVAREYLDQALAITREVLGDE